MSSESAAIRLAGKLLQLTEAGKIRWVDAGRLGPWGTWPGQVFKSPVEDASFAQIAEVPVPNSSIASYYFGVAEGEPEISELAAGGKEILKAFAEGFPAEPSEENRQLLDTLKRLYTAARDNAWGARQKVERFEQLLERMG